MVKDMNLGQNRPAAFPMAVWYKLSVVMVEVNIVPSPATLLPITQVATVDCFYTWFSGHMDYSINENERCYSSYHGARRGSRSQYIILF